jgi:hypothetical protein
MKLFSIFRQLKWARRIAVVLTGLIFAGIIVGVLLLLNLDRVVKTGIERGGGIILGVPVTVADVDVSLLRGTAEVRELTMGSPEGYEAEKMLTLKRGYIEMEFRSLLGDEIIIHNVELEEPDVMVEFGGEEGSNWKTLMARLATADEEEAKKPVRIDRIVVEGTKLRVSGGGWLTNNPLMSGRALSLPRLEVSEFATGADNTLTIAEALYSLVRDMVAAIGRKLGGLGERADDLREEAGGIMPGN